METAPKPNPHHTSTTEQRSGSLMNSLGFSDEAIREMTGGERVSESFSEVVLSPPDAELSLPGAPHRRAAAAEASSPGDRGAEMERETELEPASSTELSAPADDELLTLACPKCEGELVIRREHVGIEGACVWCDMKIVAARSGLDQVVRVFPVFSPDSMKAETLKTPSAAPLESESDAPSSEAEADSAPATSGWEAPAPVAEEGLPSPDEGFAAKAAETPAAQFSGEAAWATPMAAETEAAEAEQEAPAAESAEASIPAGFGDHDVDAKATGFSGAAAPAETPTAPSPGFADGFASGFGSPSEKAPSEPESASVSEEVPSSFAEAKAPDMAADDKPASSPTDIPAGFGGASSSETHKGFSGFAAELPAPEPPKEPTPATDSEKASGFEAAAAWGAPSETPEKATVPTGFGSGSSEKAESSPVSGVSPENEPSANAFGSNTEEAPTTASEDATQQAGFSIPEGVNSSPSDAASSFSAFSPIPQPDHDGAKAQPEIPAWGEPSDSAATFDPSESAEVPSTPESEASPNSDDAMVDPVAPAAAEVEPATSDVFSADEPVESPAIGESTATPPPLVDSTTPAVTPQALKKARKGPRKGLIVFLVILVGLVCGAALASFALPVEDYVLKAQSFMDQKFNPSQLIDALPTGSDALTPSPEATASE